MIDHVTAAAPRFLMRLFEIERTLSQLNLIDTGPLNALELGPGLGDIASWLLGSPYVMNLTLVECSPEALKLLQQRFENNRRITLANSLTDDMKQLGLCLAFEVLEHIENDLSVLQALFNCLQPGGMLVGSVPAYMHKWDSADEYAGHVRRYEPKELRIKLEQIGFTEIRIETYGFPVTNFISPLSKLYYRYALKRQGTRTPFEATQQSGISRGFVLQFNKRFIYYLLRLFSPLQRIPLLRNLGDGLIFTAKRAS